MPREAANSLFVIDVEISPRIVAQFCPGARPSYPSNGLEHWRERERKSDIYFGFIWIDRESVSTFMLRNKLHSSRMRTARALTISPSMFCTGGVSAPGGV